MSAQMQSQTLTLLRCEIVNLLLCWRGMTNRWTIINSLKADSATAWDDIFESFLRRYSDHITRPLTYISNLSISTGVFPDQLKRSVVYPIYKAVDQSRFNHSPTCILPALSKISERILKNRLINYFVTNRLLSDNQVSEGQIHIGCQLE